MTTTAAAARELGHCQEKLALIRDIKAVIGELLTTYVEELEAVLGGDFSAGAATEARLRNLCELKALYIERYRNHVSNHGC